MSHASKVSRRLAEAVAPEVIEHVYAPRLAAEMVVVFPLLSAANAAHLVMLARQGILSREHARAIAGALLRMDEEGVGAIHPDPALEDAHPVERRREVVAAARDVQPPACIRAA